MKKLIGIGLIAVFALSLSACSRTITPEKYTEAMVALGCKGGMTLETAPEGEKTLKELGLTLQQIQQFRQKTKPDVIAKVSMEIARRVAECHGVKLEMPPAALPNIPSSLEKNPATETPPEAGK